MNSVFGDTAASDRPVRSVLFVCTGNVCRSPFAELLLRDRTPGLTVASAGIHALAGEPMEEQMAAELADRSIAATSFRARQVGEGDVQADLILTMSDRQRRYLIEEFPRAARRVGRISDVDTLAALAPQGGGLTIQQVGQWTRTRRDCGDIPDPYRRGRNVAAAVAARLDGLLDELARALT